MNGQFSDIFTELESWYDSDRGQYLLDSTRQALQPMLDTTFGYHILQLGPSLSRPLLEGSPIHHRIYAAPRAGGSTGLLCCTDELPLESDSVDVVVAHHCLEFSDNPHQVLRELQRVLTPQGHLLLVGFNPHSLSGLGRRVTGLSSRSLWHRSRHRAVGQGRLTDWLHLLGCEVQERRQLYSLPPIGGDRMRQWLAKGDAWCNQRKLPLGGAYVTHAIKQVSALHRPRAGLRLRSERLIGLAVPKPGVAPSPTPTLPTRNSGALNRIH